MMRMPANPKRPGKINPDGGEPEKGAPDVGEPSHGTGARDGDEPFPPPPGSESTVIDKETGLPKSERGEKASFDRKGGEVHGSGSGAGGGGNPEEDYDSDPMAGGGAEPMTGPRPINEAERRPRDPHGETYG